MRGRKIANGFERTLHVGHFRRSIGRTLSNGPLSDDHGFMRICECLLEPGVCSTARLALPAAVLVHRVGALFVWAVLDARGFMPGGAENFGLGRSKRKLN